MFEMISRIYQIAGSSRKKITVGILCNILKSFFQSFMMLSVFLIMLNLDTLTSSIILKAVTIILISILGRFFFQWMSDRTMSGTGYDIFRDYRLEIGERLKQAPMGYFSEQNLGTIQTILTTTIADLEGYSMMAIEQMTSGVAMAFLMSFMMFFFNPIIGTLSMIGLVIGLTVLRLVRQRAAEHSPIYQAGEDISLLALQNVMELSFTEVESHWSNQGNLMRSAGIWAKRLRKMPASVYYAGVVTARTKSYSEELRYIGNYEPIISKEQFDALNKRVNETVFVD